MLSDPALYVVTGGEPPTVAQLEARYDRQVVGRSSDGLETWHNWVVRERATGEAAGFVQATVTSTEAGPRAELAWVVGTAWQGPRHRQRGGHRAGGRDDRGRRGPRWSRTSSPGMRRPRRWPGGSVFTRRPRSSTARCAGPPSAEPPRYLDVERPGVESDREHRPPRRGGRARRGLAPRAPRPRRRPAGGAVARLAARAAPRPRPASGVRDARPRAVGVRRPRRAASRGSAVRPLPRTAAAGHARHERHDDQPHRPARGQGPRRAGARPERRPQRAGGAVDHRPWPRRRRAHRPPRARARDPRRAVARPTRTSSPTCCAA